MIIVICFSAPFPSLFFCFVFFKYSHLEFSFLNVSIVYSRPVKDRKMMVVKSTQAQLRVIDVIGATS